MVQKMRTAFTLLELLVSIGILSILAAIVIVGINPVKQLSAARDADRQHTAQELENAFVQYLIETGDFPGDKELPVGQNNAMQICRRGKVAATCINVDAMFPDYMPCVPYDGAESNPDYTGFQVYSDIYRPHILAAHVGEGAVPGGCE